MKKTILPLALLCTVLTLSILSCKKDSSNPPAPTMVKEWTVALSPKYENPARAGRTETGTASIKLMSDNKINFTINVTGLAAGDALTAAHIHAGNVITNGGVVLGFDPVFSGSTATGNIKAIRTSFVDSLKNNVNELYFNVHSTLLPGGLLRGQLNVAIEMAEDIEMTGVNETSPVSTTATGLAILRLTADKKLYSKVTIANLEAGDALTVSHIHKAAAGANGSPFITLCENAADFGVAKMFVLTDLVFTSVNTDQVYVNAHSTNHGSGLVRGQIR